jgi:branched-chain amino acid transport system permease protein
MSYQLSYLNLPLSLFGIMAIQAMGLQLILGRAGILTLGHSAFFAIGGYSSAVFVAFLGPSLGIADPNLLLFFGIMAALFSTSVVATLLAIPCLRLNGDYLAIATLAFSQITENILNNLSQVGGSSGFVGITRLTHLPLIFALVLLVGIFLNRFYKTGLGQAMVCMRESEVVANCFGISTKKTKFSAFLIGNMIIGLSGALYAHTIQFISPVSASFHKSAEVLLALVVGGVLSIRGSLIGAAILVFVPELLRFIPLPMADYSKIYFPTDNSLLLMALQFVGSLFQQSTVLLSLMAILLLKSGTSGVVSMIYRGARKPNATSP